MRSRKLVLGAIGGSALSLLAATAARADVITHFGDGVGAGLGPHLDAVGIGASNTAAETTATSFFVGGPPATNTTLTFHLVSDVGSFNFQFGYFNMSAVTADPITDRQNFAVQALSGATLVFDDITHNPPATVTTSVAAGTQLGFFIVPNNTIANFLANPSAFYPATLDPIAFRTPLFSLSDANPGEYDQMLSFVGNGKTMFAFEDLTRVGASDNNFTDLIFSIDAQLAVVPPDVHPVPLPAAAWGGLLLIAGLGAKRVRDNRNVATP